MSVPTESQEIIKTKKSSEETTQESKLLTDSLPPKVDEPQSMSNKSSKLGSLAGKMSQVSKSFKDKFNNKNKTSPKGEDLIKHPSAPQNIEFIGKDGDSNKSKRQKSKDLKSKD